MILLLGANGNMGKRYQAILRYLRIKYTPVDLNEDWTPLNFAHAIVATPTETHLPILRKFADMGVNILCEKPISKSLDELKEIKSLKLNLTMMMQYKLLDEPSSKGLTFYDYFRHGNDGIFWDCLQPIAIARGAVRLEEKSPVWKCQLNGRVISLSDMDMAYVEFVQNWLEKPGDDIDELIDIHEKVMELAGGA